MEAPVIVPFTSLPHVSDFVLVRYVGPNKISAIKAVRNMLWIGLKEAKDLIEWPGGFEMPQMMFETVRRHYCDSSHLGHYAEDWKLGDEYPPITINFRRGLTE